jgi:hypothetical protein
MNDFTKESITTHMQGCQKCQKCHSKINDTAAIFWNSQCTKIIETRASCSNKTCDYILVIKNE